MDIQKYSDILKKRIVSVIDSRATWEKEEIKSRILGVFADVADVHIAFVEQHANFKQTPQSLTVSEEMERKRIVQMLLLTFGNKNRTAKLLSMNHNTLLDKMRRYGIEYL
jgi:DNA-binding NtrC family response regulator